MGEGTKGAKRGTARARGSEVEQFLGRLKHARREDVLAVRDVVRRAHPDVTERVKWNAPSFCIDGDDRITFRLQPRDHVQLIFHRGAKAKKDGFTFKDASGLVEWVTADRGVVDFADSADVRRNGPALRNLVKAWMEATREK